MIKLMNLELSQSSYKIEPYFESFYDLSIR